MTIEAQSIANIDLPHIAGHWGVQQVSFLRRKRQSAKVAVQQRRILASSQLMPAGKIRCQN